LDAKQKGASTAQVTKAFFAGMFGMYDPANPDAGFIENIRTNRQKTQERNDSSDTLKNLIVPGFTGSTEWNKHKDEAENYNNYYSPIFEDAFYEWMDKQDPNHPNYYPRIEGINGAYHGTTWVWYEGKMPLWNPAPGKSGTFLYSLDDIQIKEFTDMPTWERAPVSSGGGLGCWVAREVYGESDRRWLVFREWMLNDSPSWFRELYLKYGEVVAKFISDKPTIKFLIKSWMSTKIPRGVDLYSEKYDFLMNTYEESVLRQQSNSSAAPVRLKSR
jgi:hypothetical protein